MLHTPITHPKTTPFRPIADLIQPRELLTANRHRVLLLTLQPGEALPAQYHLYADKTLMVLEGCATVVSDTGTRLLYEGETGTIAFGTKHRLKNEGKIPLRLLEIRAGACVEDDDTAA